MCFHVSEDDDDDEDDEENGTENSDGNDDENDDENEDDDDRIAEKKVTSATRARQQSNIWLICVSWHVHTRLRHTYLCPPKQGSKQGSDVSNPIMNILAICL